MRLAVVLLVALVLTSTCVGSLVILSTFDQAKAVMSDETTPYLLLFVDTTDVNSVRMSRLMEDVAVEVSGFATVALVDVRAPELAFLMSAWNIQAVPVLKLLPPAKQGHASERRIGHVRGLTEFDRKDLSIETIKSFALRGIPSRGYMERIDKDVPLSDILRRFGKSAVNVSVLVTERSTTSLLYRRLALNYTGRLGFVEIVSDKCPKLAATLLNGQCAPRLLVLDAVSMQPLDAYDGQFEIHQVSSFLDAHAVPLSVRISQQRLERNATLRSLLQR